MTKKLKTYAIIVLILGGLFGLLYWRATAPKPGVAYPNQGQKHIPDSERFTEYNSNPPASGPHYQRPARVGVYDEELLDERLVHNLEHGHIWISYRDKDDKELIEKLKKLAEGRRRVIMTYRPKNDSAIAVAAWTRLLKLNSYDEDKIKDFISAWINQGPEKVMADE